MSSPAVSVIIPVYNRAASVGAAIASALGQSFDDLEVIVVDDGSDDSTAQIVTNIADPRLQLIAHESNRGAAAARNTGIQASTGRLIALLDSDDVWLPGKLARQVPMLDDASKNQEVCCSSVVLHLLDHGLTRLRRVGDSSNWAHTLALGCDLSPGTTLLARREAFDRIGPFDEALPRFEDWDWLFRYTRQGEIVVAAEPLAHVYVRRGRLGEQVEQSTRLFLDKHKSELRSLPKSIRECAITDAWLQVVAAYGFEGRFGDAIRPFLFALRQRPFTSILRSMRGIYYFARGKLLNLLGTMPRQPTGESL